MSEEKELSDREANKLFWKDYNAICKQCTGKCKQSYKVTLKRCPDYKEKVIEN